MTDVLDIVRVSVVAPIGNSDHSSCWQSFRWLRLFRTCVLVGKFSFKHQVNWNMVCGAMQYLIWRNLWSADNPVEVLNEHLLLLVGRFVPTKIIRVCNKDKPWFDDQ